MSHKENRRKVRAILAGGLVLGVGAALTLAAWNSSEFATGAFGTGAFTLEGKTPAEADFGKHGDAETAAELAFTMDPTVDLANLSPGDTVRAPFAVRLDSNTTFPAEISVSSTVANPVEGLKQRVYVTNGLDCVGPAGTVLVEYSALVTFTGIPTVPLTVGVGTAPGTPVNLCFEVTADNTLAQNGIAEATWEIVATQQKN